MWDISSPDLLGRLGVIKVLVQDLGKNLWLLDRDLGQIRWKNKPLWIPVTVAAVGSSVGYYVWKQKGIKQRVREKYDASLESIERLAEYLTDHGLKMQERDEILKLSLTELIHKLQNNELTSVDVLHAYQSKAIEATRSYNCVVEPIWEAEAIALERDMYKGEKGPLHGVPVSVKENCNLEGYDITGGLLKYCDQPAPNNAVLVEVLKHLGAVPFVRTNIPQTMMSFECSNPLYGTTSNPHDVTRIPGGSSGGEACLLAAGGSILGIGSDIGGSIRIPSHMCGTYGIKPTFSRISVKNKCKFGAGQQLVQSVLGPMARDVDSLVLFMQNVLHPYMYQLDPTVSPVPFRNEIYKSKAPLRIGYYVDNGYITPVPACQRAVRIAKQVLESKGHTVCKYVTSPCVLEFNSPTLVEFKLPDTKDMFELFIKACFADGCEAYANVYKEDITDPTVKFLFRTFTWSHMQRKVFSWIISTFGKDAMMYRMTKAMCGCKSVTEYWKLAVEIEGYKQLMLDMWQKQKLDAVIAPGFGCPATPTGTVKYVTGAVTYTVLYNLLDYPAGSVPVTKVNEQDELDLAQYPAKTAFEKYIKKYSAGAKGLPINVQCAALPFQEETVLRVMKEIQDGLKS